MGARIRQGIRLLKLNTNRKEPQVYYRARRARSPGCGLSGVRRCAEAKGTTTLTAVERELWTTLLALGRPVIRAVPPAAGGASAGGNVPP